MIGPSIDISVISLCPLEEYLKDPVSTAAWISSFNISDNKMDIVASIKVIDEKMAISKVAFILNRDMNKIYKMDIHSKSFESKPQKWEIVSTKTYATTTSEITIQGTLISLTETEKFLCNVRGITFDE